MWDFDVIKPEDLITYELIFQEAACEYHNHVDSKQREPSSRKYKSQYNPSLPKAYTI